MTWCFTKLLEILEVNGQGSPSVLQYTFVFKFFESLGPSLKSLKEMEVSHNKRESSLQGSWLHNEGCYEQSLKVPALRWILLNKLAINNLG